MDEKYYITRDDAIHAITTHGGLRGDALKALYDLPHITKADLTAEAEQMKQRCIEVAEKDVDYFTPAYTDIQLGRQIEAQAMVNTIEALEVEG